MCACLCSLGLIQANVVVHTTHKPTFLIVVCCKAASLKEELDSCKEEKIFVAREHLLDGHKFEAYMVN
jgi:hypothetical protein